MIQRAPAEMDLPDIVAAAWKACVRHWSLLVRIALLGALVSAASVYVLIELTPAPAGDEEPTAAAVQEASRRAAPVIVAAAVTSLFTHLALVRAGLDVLRGRPAGVLRALGEGLRRLPAGTVAVFVILFVTAALLSAATLVPPLGLIAGPLIAYVAVSWLLAVEVVVDERRGPFAALRRSRELVRGLWWRTCIIGLSVLVLYLFPSIILAWVGGAFESELVQSALAGVAFLLGAPFLALGHTQLYLDNRRRKGEPVEPSPPLERAS